MQSYHFGLLVCEVRFRNFQFGDWDFLGTTRLLDPITGPAAVWAALTRKLDIEEIAQSRDF